MPASPAKGNVVAEKKERPWLGALLAALRSWRGATVQEKEGGGASFRVGKKIFAFTRPEGIAMKLPEARIRALMAHRNAEFLTMGQRTLREWMLLRVERSVTNEDRALLREAMEFVAGKKSSVHRVTCCTRTGPLPLLPSGPGGVGGIASRRTRHTCDSSTA